MLAVIHFPLTDVRPFLDQDTHRTAGPIWPIVDLPDEPRRAPFVRGFGRARKRLAGGVAEFPAEEAYCDVSGVLRFRQAVLKDGAEGLKSRLKHSCAFRRLAPGVEIETGNLSPHRRWERSSMDCSGKQCTSRRGNWFRPRRSR
jgi:hypothetical protein